MHWTKIDDIHKPENDTLYAICTWNKTYKRSIPADAFAVCGKYKKQWVSIYD